MLLGPKKRTRVSDEESDNSMENREVFNSVLMNFRSKSKETGNIMQKDLKRMRLDLEHDTSRVVPSEFFNSSSESSPRTPSPHSTHTDTTEYTSPSYPYHQVHHRHQQQKQKSLDDNHDTSFSSQNTHKLHRNPIRISTRSDASSSSELLNPYMNINSVLYLANLTRTSHIVNELQDDLGCMEIDERVDTHNNGRERLIGNGTTTSMEEDSMNLGLGHHHQLQSGGYVNGSSDRYQSINAILREAFLRRRHQNMGAQI